MVSSTGSVRHGRASGRRASIRSRIARCSVVLARQRRPAVRRRCRAAGTRRRPRRRRPGPRRRTAPSGAGSGPCCSRPGAPRPAAGRAARSGSGAPRPAGPRSACRTASRARAKESSTDPGVNGPPSGMWVSITHRPSSRIRLNASRPSQKYAPDQTHTSQPCVCSPNAPYVRRCTDTCWPRSRRPLAETSGGTPRPAWNRRTASADATSASSGSRPIGRPGSSRRSARTRGHGKSRSPTRASRRPPRRRPGLGRGRRAGRHARAGRPGPPA